MIGWFGRPPVGLDLGTANTLIYVHGHGGAVNEPSPATIRSSTGENEAAGNEAGAVPGELTDVKRLAAIASLRNVRVADVPPVITVTSLPRTVFGRSIPVAGDEMDAAIATYVWREHQLPVGGSTTERIKIPVGSELPGPEARCVNVKGRCLVHGIPREIALCDGEIRDALSPPVQ